MGPCRQFLDPVVTLPFAVGGGSVSLPLSIPANPVLVGLRAYAQSATFSPGLDPLGVVASNGVELLLDAR
jgi:hypothetical protein